MKKSSGFKMKGFSGFGNSPMKVDLTKKTGEGPRANRIRVSDKYKVGDFISEDDLESKFKRKGGDPKDYPQLSVQDYSRVKKDDMGLYVEKL
jgi:hypothetical protein